MNNTLSVYKTMAAHTDVIGSTFACLHKFVCSALHCVYTIYSLLFPGFCLLDSVFITLSCTFSNLTKPVAVNYCIIQCPSYVYAYLNTCRVNVVVFCSMFCIYTSSLQLSSAVDDIPSPPQSFLLGRIYVVHKTHIVSRVIEIGLFPVHFLSPYFYKKNCCDWDAGSLVYFSTCVTSLYKGS